MNAPKTVVVPETHPNVIECRLESFHQGRAGL